MYFGVYIKFISIDNLLLIKITRSILSKLSDPITKQVVNVSQKLSNFFEVCMTYYFIGFNNMCELPKKEQKGACNNDE